MLQHPAFFVADPARGIDPAVKLCFTAWVRIRSGAARGLARGSEASRIFATGELPVCCLSVLFFLLSIPRAGSTQQ